MQVLVNACVQNAGVSGQVLAALDRAGATDTDAITYQPIAWRAKRGTRPQAPDTFDLRPEP